MPITQTAFGTTPQGAAVHLYTLTNKAGAIAKVITYGAILTELHVPDRNGRLANVVLGFDALAPYMATHPYFGATIGRYANRIANARFALDGKTYSIVANEGANTLHGGKVGFDRVVWQPHIVDSSLELTYTSQDGEQGFPGTVCAAVTYRLTDDNALVISFRATTDKPTVVNLCNHSYFNLGGAGSGPVADHVLQLDADAYTPVNDALIPTGQIAAVDGTPLDFRTPTAIGARIGQVAGGGYDHNFVIRKAATGPLAHAATVVHPVTGRVLEVLTTQPGVQLYTGNFLDGTISGNGGRYDKHGAFCLETQHFPDSPNQPNFPSTVLRPGQTYQHQAVYHFKTV